MRKSHGLALVAAAAASVLCANRAQAIVQTYSAASGVAPLQPGGGNLVARDHPGFGFFQFDPGLWDTGLDASPTHPQAGEFAFSGSDGSFHMEVHTLLNQGVTSRTGDHAAFFEMNYNPDSSGSHSFGSFWFGGVGNDIGPYPHSLGAPVAEGDVLLYADVIAPAGKPMEFRTESDFISTGHGRKVKFTGTGAWQTVGGAMSGAIQFGNFNKEDPQLASLIAFGQTPNPLPPDPPTDEIDAVDNGSDPNNIPTVMVDNLTLTIRQASWNVDGSGNWSADGNWNPVAPDGANATAIFGNVITAPTTVTVDGTHFAGTVQFDSAQSYNLNGGGVLTIRGINDGVFSGSGAISDISGNHTISAPTEIWSDTTITVAQAANTLTLSNLLPAPFPITLTKAGAGKLVVNNIRAHGLAVTVGQLQVAAGGSPNSPSGTSVVNTLSISAGAKLDLTNNSAIVDYTGAVGTQVTDIRTHLKNGELLTSAGSATTRLGYGDNAVLGKVTFAGQSVDSSSILIKFTYAGDADLDGDADGVDIGTWATNFTGELGGTGSAVWTQGDWDYDGDVDGV
ncbi:MAG TPA: hypothetical protein VH518_17575, partial [Tepidisphaeraceae bacterium]